MLGVIEAVEGLWYRWAEGVMVARQDAWLNRSGVDMVMRCFCYC